MRRLERKRAIGPVRLILAWTAVACAGTAGAQPPAAAPLPTAPAPAPSPATPPAPAMAAAAATRSILDPNTRDVDLGTVLRLAGVQNPALLVARQRVLEAVALRQYAAAQILPTLNGGTNYDSHTGTLQQSNGNILTTTRSALYVGAGAYAVAAGTVAVPGVVLSGNVAEGLYLYLTSRQVVRQREFASAAVQNQALLDVALAYTELIRAEGHRAIAEQIRADAQELARVTAAYARSGEGRLADADRAATELARRRARLRRAEGEILTASARLCQLLNLDPSIRLHPTDAYAVPQPVVPDPIPLSELVAIALMQRPELGERRAAIREALLALEGAKVLPFSPTILIGFSAGGFGGGSNLVSPVFGGFGGRSDFDAMAYWTIRNLGVGNIALINLARARLQVNQFRELAVMDQVRDEVAEAYARTHARFAQVAENEDAVRSAIQGFRLDLERIKQGVPADEAKHARPIEVINSLRLLADSKDDYLDAIVDYNQAHFEMYVALGQPPLDAMAQPVPVDGGVPVRGVQAPGRAEAPAPGTPPPPAGGNPPFAAPPAVRPGG